MPRRHGAAANQPTRPGNKQPTSSVHTMPESAAPVGTQSAAQHPDCPDQSCPDCQTHLHDVQAFDQMADRMLQAAKAAPAAHHGRTEPSVPPRQPGLAADKEAGQ